MYEDINIDPAAAEERERIERETELARRIRREVLRVQRGEADDEIRAEEEQERIEQQEREEREARAQRRRSSLWWQMLSGRILVPKEGSTGYYRYILFIAAMFFVSIVVMFTTLRLDIRHGRLQDEVRILKERSTRLQEQRFDRTTHSAIVRELERRGIDLRDPREPATPIKD